MVRHKTSGQYLTSGKVSTRSIHGFKRYRLLKALIKTFNILSNADAVVTAIALPVLSYRRAKRTENKHENNVHGKPQTETTRIKTQSHTHQKTDARFTALERSVIILFVFFCSLFACTQKQRR